MRAKLVLAVVAAMALLLGAGMLARRRETPKPPVVCQICGRNIPKQTAFEIVTAHGTIFACCPRCAMHHMLDHPDLVREAWATDFDSGRKIPAQAAYYDEGGNVQYCTASDNPVERAPQGLRRRVYDRCLPTLVAFATHNAAEAYRRQHGGRILDYEQALARVRSQ